MQNNHDPHRNLIALLEFSASGFLKNIYLCNSNERDEKVLEGSLRRLFKEGLWRMVMSPGLSGREKVNWCKRESDR